jgi:hypothetical protein
MKTGVNVFVLKAGGRHGPMYDAIYLPICLCVWDFVTRLSADWAGLASLLLFGLSDTIFVFVDCDILWFDMYFSI